MGEMEDDTEFDEIVEDREEYNAPFVRNAYFFGKLMTVADFELEQRYLNEKRHLINAAFHGDGIVEGLDVVEYKHEEKIVKIEPGMAIDSLGQEIIVSESVEYHNISTEYELEDTDLEQVGLYIKRVDEKKDPVYAPAFETHPVVEQKCSESRIVENVELYLSSLDKSEYEEVVEGVLLAIIAKDDEGNWEIDERLTEQNRKYLVNAQDIQRIDEAVNVDIPEIISDIENLDNPLQRINGVGNLESEQEHVPEIDLVSESLDINTHLTDRDLEENEIGLEIKDASPSVTTGIVKLELDGKNEFFGPFNHAQHLASPPAILLGKASTEDEVEFMEGFKIKESRFESAGFKAVNINQDTFMIRVNAEVSGKLDLRWWAIPAKEVEIQHAEPIKQPTITFDRPEYRLEESFIVRVVDPNIKGEDKTKRDSIKVNISSDTNPSGTSVDAWESTAGTGIFMTQRLRTRDFARNIGEKIISTYIYKMGGKDETVTDTTQIIITSQPTIRFNADVYSIWERGTITIADAGSRRVQKLGVILSSKDEQKKKKIIATQRRNGKFVGEFAVKDLVSKGPDQLMAKHSYQHGDITKEVTAIADVLKAVEPTINFDQSSYYADEPITITVTDSSSDRIRSRTDTIKVAVTSKNNPKNSATIKAMETGPDSLTFKTEPFKVSELISGTSDTLIATTKVTGANGRIIELKADVPIKRIITPIIEFDKGSYDITSNLDQKMVITIEDKNIQERTSSVKFELVVGQSEVRRSVLSDTIDTNRFESIEVRKSSPKTVLPAKTIESIKKISGKKSYIANRVTTGKYQASINIKELTKEESTIQAIYYYEKQDTIGVVSAITRIQKRKIERKATIRFDKSRYVIGNTATVTITDSTAPTKMTFALSSKNAKLMKRFLADNIPRKKGEYFWRAKITKSFPGKYGEMIATLHDEKTKEVLAKATTQVLPPPIMLGGDQPPITASKKEIPTKKPGSAVSIDKIKRTTVKESVPKKGRKTKGKTPKFGLVNKFGVKKTEKGSTRK